MNIEVPDDAVELLKHATRLRNEALMADDEQAAALLQAELSRLTLNLCRLIVFQLNIGPKRDLQ